MKTLKQKAQFLTIILVLACFQFTACNNGNEEEERTIEKVQIAGKLEKGPFVQGSKVIMYELNNSLSQTGKSYKTNTTSDLGEFSFDSSLTLSSQYVELETNGFFYNEIEGQLSHAPITLNALVDLSNKEKVNVNLITHLEFERVKKLFKEGKTFKDAKKQAEQELLACFAITHKIDNPEAISLTDGNDNSKILLAISSILLYQQSEAGFSELISKFSTDFAQNGKITDVNIRQEIQSGQYNISPKSIVKKMEEYYAKKGTSLSIKEFSQYVDHNGDGVLDENDKFEDLAPDGSLTEDNIFQDTSNIAAFLNGIYAKLVDFTTLQLTIEAIRTQKLTDNHYDLHIDANSRYVSDLWSAGYRCIQNANLLLEKIEIYNNQSDISSYKLETRLLRAFIYYNMTLLWKDIPLLTNTLSLDNAYDIRQSSQSEILDFVRNELDEILPKLPTTFNENNGSKCRMGYYSALVLTAEVRLMQNKKAEAASILNKTEWNEFAGEQTEKIYNQNGQSTIFSLSLLSYSNTGSLFSQFLKKGEFQPVYTYAHIKLLREETKNVDMKSIPDVWQQQTGVEYGYWGALIRTNTAILTTNCKEHELLLPIPRKELDLCPNLKQNLGY